MTGPDQETAAGRGHLRAAHADRERAIDVLKAAFVQGQLDKDEFEARVGQVFASRTYAELAALTADLPASPAAARPPRPVRAQAEQPVLRPVPVILAANAFYAGLWMFALFGPGGPAGNAAAEALGMLTVFYISIVIGAVIALVASRHQKCRGGQLPPGPVAG